MIRRLAMEQWKQGVISLTGKIHWVVVDSQTPHWVFNAEEDYTMRAPGRAAIYYRTGGVEREQNRKVLGAPFCDRDTIYSTKYGVPKGGKKRTVYDKDGFAFGGKGDE